MRRAFLVILLILAGGGFFVFHPVLARTRRISDATTRQKTAVRQIAPVPHGAAPATGRVTKRQKNTSRRSATPKNGSRNKQARRRTAPRTNGANSPAPVAAAWAQLKINEIMPQPQAGAEWVELFNPTAETIKLRGGALCNDRKIKSCIMLVLDGEIGPTAWRVFGLPQHHLKHKADTIILYDPSGKPVDHVAYGNNLPAPAKGYSLARRVDGKSTGNDLNDWAVTTRPTPGAANAIVAPPSKPSRRRHATKTTNKSMRKKSRVQSSTNNPLAPTGQPVIYGNSTTNVSAPDVNAAAADTSALLQPPAYATSTSEARAESSASVTIVSQPPAQPQANQTGQDNASTPTSVDTTVQPAPAEQPSGEQAPADNDQIVQPEQPIALSLKQTAEPLAGQISPPQKITYAPPTFAPPTKEAAPLPVTIPPLPGAPLSNKIKIRALSGGRGRAIYKLSLSDARSQESGTRVITSGVVTALPDTFSSRYFYIMDGSSAGLQIYDPKSQFPALALGDTISVAGDIGFTQSVPHLRVKPYAPFRVIKSGPEPRPLELPLESIDERNFGALITTSGEITKTKNALMYLDSGQAEAAMAFKKTVEIDRQSLREGDVIKITGIVEQAKSGWEIWPRNNDDIAVTGHNDIKKNQAASANSPWGLYGAIGAGGVVLLGAGWFIRRQMVKNGPRELTK